MNRVVEIGASIIMIARRMEQTTNYTVCAIRMLILEMALQLVSINGELNEFKV